MGAIIIISLAFGIRVRYDICAIPCHDHGAEKVRDTDPNIVSRSCAKYYCMKLVGANECGGEAQVRKFKCVCKIVEDWCGDDTIVMDEGLATYEWCGRN